MKTFFTVISLVLGVSITVSAQDDTMFRFIFIPHVRSENTTGQLINPGIANIDLSRYSLRMLGGDLTKTTDNSANLAYADSIFDLKNPNTLWSFGNHDVESGNRSLLRTFLGREGYYTYARDGITWLILDTELDAESFSRTFIKGAQLDTLKAVCDRVTKETTKFFIVMHSRYMWMINNSYFTQSMKDSIAASSKSMDSTNWYSDVMPELRKVKAKGIPVLVFGGDKSQINVTYSPEDSITFFAARMENTFTDSVNNVIVIDYAKNKSIGYTYVTLDKINGAIPVAVSVPLHAGETAAPVHRLTCSVYGSAVRFMVPDAVSDGVIRTYALDGTLRSSVAVHGGYASVSALHPGVYIAEFTGTSAVSSLQFTITR